MTTRRRALLIAVAVCVAATQGPRATDAPRLPPTHAEQGGKVPAGVDTKDALVLINQSDTDVATILLDFDLSKITDPVTPLARLNLTNVARLKLDGVPPARARAAMQVWATLPGQEKFLASSTPAKPPSATPFSYAIDVTKAVNAALARPTGDRKLRLELRLAGKPGVAAYTMPFGASHPAPTLEIIPPTNWTDDFAQRMTPFAVGPLVYREACMPIAASRNEDITLPLLYPAKRIVEVIHNGTGEILQQGREYLLRDGKLILPPNSRAPVQLESEFFNPPPKTATAPAHKGPVPYRLEEGTWYHTRQLEVTYEPTSRDSPLPAPISSLDKLPRTKSLLEKKSPLRLVLFGDSISIGGNASRFQGAWPYQPCYGDLLARALEEHYGSRITFMNHSQAGGTSSFAADQAESLVGYMTPDLCVIAFGMNDRAPARRPVYLDNLHKAIDTIRQRSPDTEFVVVTPMMNNPKQPQDLTPAPIFFIRDQALKVDRPGVAFVDITSAHEEIIKHKPYLDTSGNGANHPNDFLHRLYAHRLAELLIPKADK